MMKPLMLACTVLAVNMASASAATYRFAEVFSPASQQISAPLGHEISRDAHRLSFVVMSMDDGASAMVLGVLAAQGLEPQEDPDGDARKLLAPSATLPALANAPAGSQITRRRDDRLA